MNNKIDIFLLLVFFIPIILGFIRKFNSNDVKESIYAFERNLLLLISGIVCLYWVDRGLVITSIIEVLNEYSFFYLLSREFSTVYFIIIFVLTLTVLYYLLKVLVKAFNAVFIYSFIDLIDRISQEQGVFFRRVLGAIFRIPAAIIYVILATFIIDILPINDHIIKSDIQESQLYEYIVDKAVNPIKESEIVSQLPRLLNNSLKIRIVNNDSSDIISVNDIPNIKKNNKNVIIYYNGVTLDEGVKSNAAIDSMADEITKGKKTSEDKAYAIYKWIGTNIEYDDKMAEEVLSGKVDKNSGAIPAFEKRSGICFDYACLYVAMCRKEGIKVRIITGQGFNGIEWVSHAWNQVYINETGQWLNVDPTFSIAGNYFGNAKFNRDHRAEDIAGEW